MWNSELHFADSFEDYLRSRGKKLKSKNKGEIVLREYKPGYGQVDIVLVRYDLGRLQKRRKQYVYCSECSAFDVQGAYAMAYLSCVRWVSRKRLSKVVNLEMSQVNQLASVLKCRGLIETKGELIKAYSKKKNWTIDCIETFELKLKNWKRALEQAGRHLWFASKSYVVMPKNSEKIAEQLVKNCQSWKVGAILYEEKGNPETIASPPHFSLPSSHVGWLLNESIISEMSHA